ncbi:hypothetical protein M413DRAFT_447443, partial [Hebeloma cylindrosporum]
MSIPIDPVDAVGRFANLLVSLPVLILAVCTKEGTKDNILFKCKGQGRRAHN